MLDRTLVQVRLQNTRLGCAIATKKKGDRPQKYRILPN